jgi:hypothetical protein
MGKPLKENTVSNTLGKNPIGKTGQG